MKIFVKAKTGKHRESVEKIDDTHFIVSVKEPPVEGKANEAILRLLADYFDVPFSQTAIVSGYVSKQKIIEVSM